MASIGEILEEARIKQARTINEAAQETRITARYIEALELDRFDELPARVVARGFLRSYAVYLQLDPAPLVEAFDHFTSDEQGGADEGHAASGQDAPRPSQAAPVDPVRRSTPPAPAVPPATTAPVGIIVDRNVAAEPEDPAAVPATVHEAPPPTVRNRVVPAALPRSPAASSSGQSRRLLAIVGGAVLAALIVFGIVMLVRGGGDSGDSIAAGVAGTSTSTAIVPSGVANSPTAASTSTSTPGTTPASSATSRSTATATSTAPGGVGGTSTATSTSGAETSTPGETDETESTPTLEATATPTEDETPQPTGSPTPALTPATSTPQPATPTATQELPTPTPVPPTPTPVQPDVATPSIYALCATVDDGVDCGSAASYTVICAPAGPFVDPAGSWVARAQQYGWVIAQASEPTRFAVAQACR